MITDERYELMKKALGGIFVFPVAEGGKDEGT